MRHSRGEDWFHGTGFDQALDMLAVTGPYVNQKATARLLDYLVLRSKTPEEEAKRLQLRQEVSTYFEAQVAREKERNRKREQQGKSPNRLREHLFDRPLELLVRLSLLDQAVAHPTSH